MSRKISPFLRALAPLPPYAGVLAGLYLLGSGWAAIGGYHLGICLVLLLSGGFRRAPSLLEGWRAAIGLGLSAVCLLSGGLIYLLWPWIALEGVELGAALEALGLSGLSWLLFIAYYSLVNPWMEELFWRGWYPSQLERPWVADLLFAGYHVFVMALFVGLGWVALTFCVLASTAWVWRLVGRHTGGLLIPCVSHLIADVSVIAAAALIAAS